jgi:hypothetical protein
VDVCPVGRISKRKTPLASVRRQVISQRAFVAAASSKTSTTSCRPSRLPNRLPATSSTSLVQLKPAPNPAHPPFADLRCRSIPILRPGNHISARISQYPFDNSDVLSLMPKKPVTLFRLAATPSTITTAEYFPAVTGRMVNGPFEQSISSRESSRTGAGPRLSAVQCCVLT